VLAEPVNIVAEVAPWYQEVAHFVCCNTSLLKDPDVVKITWNVTGLLAIDPNNEELVSKGSFYGKNLSESACSKSSTLIIPALKRSGQRITITCAITVQSRSPQQRVVISSESVVARVEESMMRCYLATLTPRLSLTSQGTSETKSLNAPLGRMEPCKC